MKWMLDPKNSLPSVSLTLMSIAFVAVVAMGTLQCIGIIGQTGIFPELFYSCAALYFGRRLNIGRQGGERK